MRKSAIQRYAALIISLLPGALSGCDSGAVVQGIIQPKGNRPPVILNARADQTASGLIRLSATVVEPDADGLTIRYEQLSGPFARQTGSLTVAGAFSALLESDGDGLYSFRIIASDGFFEAASVVSIEIVSTPVRLPPIASARPIPQGAFDIRLTGQVADKAGYSAFVRDATLAIDMSPEGAAVVSLYSRSGGTDTAGGGIRIIDLAASTPDDAADATAAVIEQLGDEIIISAQRSPVSLGSFDSSSTGREAGIRSLLIRVRIGELGAVGEVYVSSNGTSLQLLPQYADLRAQFTPNR